mmetsp:Transcript_12551/g.24506  ORF Transcript_12551/g.24506 Transcript_12551/m.24506 type:complete len:430 (+) Transcript_12551:83-1372(+)
MLATFIVFLSFRLVSGVFFPTGCQQNGSITVSNRRCYNCRPHRLFVELKFLHRGRCRAGLVRVPAHSEDKARPVVYMFHGSGRKKAPAVKLASTRKGCQRWSDKYLCVYVLSDEEFKGGQSTGIAGWETHDGERTPNRSDVLFVRQLHKAVADRWALNHTNIFAFGHSSGATFVMGRLMFEANDIFRAVAASAGRLWQRMPFYQNRTEWRSCCHVMYNYGGADHHGWGPAVHGKWGQNYGIEASGVRLARANGCRVLATGATELSQTFQDAALKHVVRTVDLNGHPVKRYVFPNCSAGQLVSFLEWTDQSHYFRGVADEFNANLMSFFDGVQRSPACISALNLTVAPKLLKLWSRPVEFFEPTSGSELSRASSSVAGRGVVCGVALSVLVAAVAFVRSSRLRRDYTVAGGTNSLLLISEAQGEQGDLAA